MCAAWITCQPQRQRPPSRPPCTALPPSAQPRIRGLRRRLRPTTTAARTHARTHALTSTHIFTCRDHTSAFCRPQHPFYSRHSILSTAATASFLQPPQHPFYSSHTVLSVQQPQHPLRSHHNMSSAVATAVDWGVRSSSHRPGSADTRHTGSGRGPIRVSNRI